jgi:hypothetical protein
MNLLMQLLPKFISDLPPAIRKVLYGAFSVVLVLAYFDYHYAKSVGVPWLDSHVITGSQFATLSLVLSGVLLMAHQKTDLPKWEEEMWGAITPELMSAPAPAGDVPNAAAEAALVSPTPPATDPVPPIVAAPAAVDPVVAPPPADVPPPA